jgi:hypothetical protein
MSDPTVAPTPEPRPEPTPAPKTSSWGTALLAGAFTLLGVVIGGFLQYLFSGLLETEKQRMQIQISAYADFAKAQAAWQRAQAQEEGDESKKKTAREAAIDDASLKIRDAAFRIVVFSPPEAVRALAEFVEQSGKRGECNITQADIALYQILRRQNSDQDSDYISNFIRQQIRGHASNSDQVSNEDIAMALFGCKLQPSR